MIISFHVPVFGSESVYGLVSGVMLDTSRTAVDSILVQQLGFLAPERLIPLTQVQQGLAERLIVQLRSEDFQHAMVFNEFVPAYEFCPSPPAFIEEHLLRQNAQIVARDGPVGRVGAIHLAAGSAQISMLVLRQGHLWGSHHIMIPMAYVQTLSEFRITLTLTCQEVATLSSLA